MLRHVAVSLQGNDYEFCVEKGLFPAQLYARRTRMVLGLIKAQVELDIPVVSVFVLPHGLKDDGSLEFNLDGVFDVLGRLKESATVPQKLVKVSVLGKWYDLPGRIVDRVKGLIEHTRDYDRFFFNLCLSYDGQEEIADACRLLCLRVKSGRLDPENVSADTIKENIYASYFPPPDLLIKGSRLDGFLLWDSPGARVAFTGRHWSELSRKEFLKLVNDAKG